MHKTNLLHKARWTGMALLCLVLAACGESATSIPAVTPLANTAIAQANGTTAAPTNATTAPSDSTTSGAVPATSAPDAATTAPGATNNSSAATTQPASKATAPGATNGAITAKPGTSGPALPTIKATQPQTGATTKPAGNATPKPTIKPTTPAPVPTDAPTPVIKVDDFPLPAGVTPDKDTGLGQSNEAITGYTSDKTVSEVADFFITNLPKQGWQAIDNPQNLKEAGSIPGAGDGVRWIKSDRFVQLSVNAIPNSKQTYIELVAHMLPNKLTLTITGKESLNGTLNVDAPYTDGQSAYGISGVYVLNNRFFDIELSLSDYTGGGKTYNLEDDSPDLTIAFGKDVGEVTDAAPYSPATSNGAKKCSVTVAQDQKSGNIACTLANADNPSNTIDLKISWVTTALDQQ